jgi:hypothetical protein
MSSSHATYDAGVIRCDGPVDPAVREIEDNSG